MKSNALYFLLSLIIISGCQQDTRTAFLPSEWIGTIQMGDGNPELVFYLYTDSLGQSAGHVGIPSKGIEKLPLDKILITKDSIHLQLSAAQASYKGALGKNRDHILGVWQEGPTTFSLKLTPLLKEIDYANSKKAITTSLDLGFESPHFNFYSKKGDAVVLEEISKPLESNYLRITKDMQTNFESKIDVLIYPDVTSFHTAINVPEASDWVVGAASRNELKMVSPLHPGSEHSYASLMKAIVHELTHTVVLNFREQGLAGVPNWLNEGYAYYEAKQLDAVQRQRIFSRLQNKTIPTWNELEKANTIEFGDMGGYVISTTIIEFLIDSYGLDALKQFIIAPEKVEEIYKLSKTALEVLWLKYLEQKSGADKLSGE
jgi:hypothetical protein